MEEISEEAAHIRTKGECYQTTPYDFNDKEGSYMIKVEVLASPYTEEEELLLDKTAQRDWGKVVPYKPSKVVDTFCYRHFKKSR